jgi:hypothetical protein
VQTPEKELLFKDDEEPYDEEPYNEELYDNILLEGRRDIENCTDTLNKIENINKEIKRTKAEMPMAIRTVLEQCAKQEGEDIAEARRDHEKAISRIKTEAQAKKDRLKDEVTRKNETKLDNLSKDIKDERRRYQELKKAGYDLGQDVREIQTRMRTRANES